MIGGVFGTLPSVWPSSTTFFSLSVFSSSISEVDVSCSLIDETKICGIMEMEILSDARAKYASTVSGHHSYVRHFFQILFLD